MNQADTIRRKLREIEAANQVKILYAVESGSRAWGFASPDSDYDVRYVFIRPIKDYLRIYPLPDHIEGPLDEVQDYSGWDIKKALGLLGKSNPSLIRMAVFPGCVCADGGMAALRGLCRCVFFGGAESASSVCVGA